MFAPAHPGALIRETIEGLREETGKAFTIEGVAANLQTTRKTLSPIINGKKGVTPEMALKIGKGFNTSADFWLQARKNYDLAQAKKRVDLRYVKVLWKHNIAV